MKSLRLFFVLLVAACQQPLYLPNGNSPKFAYFHSTNNTSLDVTIKRDGATWQGVPAHGSICSGVDIPPDSVTLDVTLRSDSITVVRDSTFLWTVKNYSLLSVAVNADSTLTITQAVYHAC